MKLMVNKVLIKKNPKFIDRKDKESKTFLGEQKDSRKHLLKIIYLFPPVQENEYVIYD